MNSLAARANAPVDLPQLPASDLGWRPVALGDAPLLAALAVRIEQADGARHRTTQADVVEHFRGSWWDLNRDTRVGWDRDGIPRAWAWTECRPSDRSRLRAFSGGGVDPLWRGRGIGTALVAWAAARGRQQLAADPRDIPGRLGAEVQDAQTEAIALYTEAGYGPLRYFTDMRRLLDQPLPVPPQTPGVRVVPWSPELDEAMRLAHNEAFEDHWGSEPRSYESWQHKGSFAPQWTFLAVDDSTGEVAGYVISGRYEQNWPVKGYRSGYTELLGVRRAWRGRGLAVALLTAVMAAYRADGMQYAELTVDSANPSGAHVLYTSLGYRPAHRIVVLGIDI